MNLGVCGMNACETWSKERGSLRPQAASIQLRILPSWRFTRLFLRIIVNPCVIAHGSGPSFWKYVAWSACGVRGATTPTCAIAARADATSATEP